MYSQFTPPDPELVLKTLAATDSTLESVAAAFHTTTLALAHWLALPDTQDLIAAFETAAACHARLQCAAALSFGFASVHRILADAAAPHSITLRAASLLLRLASHHAPKHKAREAPRSNSADAHANPSANSTPPPNPSHPAPFDFPINLPLPSAAPFTHTPFIHAATAPARLLVETASRPPPYPLTG
jgi:hypothetical protein